MQNYKEKLNEFIQWAQIVSDESIDFLELKFETIFDPSTSNSLDDLVSWYYKLVSDCDMKVTNIPLQDCVDWEFDPVKGEFKHRSNGFFKVQGIRVTGTTQREVSSGWDQPMLTQVGYDGGILGLLRKRINGIPHYLIEAKQEPGNYNIVQISTTLQATYSNIEKYHLGRAPHYAEYFLKPEEFNCKIIFDQWTSEDGGRLFNKRNRSMLIEIPEEIELELRSSSFKWVTLYNLKKLIREHNAIVAPHVRGILSGV